MPQGLSKFKNQSSLVPSSPAGGWLRLSVAARGSRKAVPPPHLLAFFCRAGIEYVRRWNARQQCGFFNRTVQPYIRIREFDRNHAAFVLLVMRKPRVRLVHARHQGVTVGVDGQHGVAFNDLPSIGVLPRVPNASESTREPVVTSERPPNVTATFPARLVERPSRNDAAPPFMP